jgi:hypothetical protein
VEISRRNRRGFFGAPAVYEEATCAQQHSCGNRGEDDNDGFNVASRRLDIALWLDWLGLSADPLEQAAVSGRCVMGERWEIISLPSLRRSHAREAAWSSAKGSVSHRPCRRVVALAGFDLARRLLIALGQLADR